MHAEGDNGICRVIRADHATSAGSTSGSSAVKRSRNRSSVNCWRNRSAAARAHRVGRRAIAQHPDDALVQLRAIAGRHEPPSVAVGDDLGGGAARADAGPPRPHRFDEHEAEALVAARHHERAAARILAAKRRVLQPAEKQDLRDRDRGRPPCARAAADRRHRRRCEGPRPAPRRQPRGQISRSGSCPLYRSSTAIRPTISADGGAPSGDAARRDRFDAGMADVDRCGP